MNEMGNGNDINGFFFLLLSVSSLLNSFGGVVGEHYSSTSLKSFATTINIYIVTYDEHCHFNGIPTCRLKSVKRSM